MSFNSHLPDSLCGASGKVVPDEVKDMVSSFRARRTEDTQRFQVGLQGLRRLTVVPKSKIAPHEASN